MTTLNDFFGPKGNLAQCIPGYEERPGQQALAHSIADTIDNDGSLIAEAGTGTGKSLAYLLPAILSGRKVLITTGTKNLQEQLFRKDLALAEKAMGLEADAALLKGVSNYLCRRKLLSHLPGQVPEIDSLVRWSHHTQTGDFSEYPHSIEGIRHEVTTTTEARMGPRCPYYEKCFVTKARRLAASAQLIVANHHLFLSDLVIKQRRPGAGVLPSYEVLIVDEAHRLEEAALQHFGTQVSSIRLRSLAEDAKRIFGTLKLAVPEALSDKADAAVANIQTLSRSFFGVLREDWKHLPFRFGKAILPPEFPSDLVERAWHRLDASLEVLEHCAMRFAEMESGDAPMQTADSIFERTEHLRADLGHLLGAHRRNYVLWGERDGDSTFLRASPLQVGPILNRAMTRHSQAQIFTSATVRVNGSFDYIRNELGYAEDEVETKCFPSPFPYASNVMLYLPQDLPEPNDDAFLAESLKRTIQLLELTAGRTFVLFTSHSALNYFARELAKEDGFSIFAQGSAERSVLLDQFRSAEKGVLLGSASFWEGVDVPGDALCSVILHRLPFGAPDEPVLQARVEHLMNQGRDPFAELQLPKAVLSLVQGFGRLVRRQKDYGVVSVLDGRIVKRQYGSQFLDSLPKTKRTSTFEQVRRFWMNRRNLHSQPTSRGEENALQQL